MIHFSLQVLFFISLKRLISEVRTIFQTHLFRIFALEICRLNNVPHLVTTNSRVLPTDSCRFAFSKWSLERKHRKNRRSEPLVKSLS